MWRFRNRVNGGSYGNSVQTPRRRRCLPAVFLFDHTRDDLPLRPGCRAGGVPVGVSTQVRHLHLKFAVIDSRYVVTGSFNWTESGERRNRENLVILDCPEMAQAFSAEWESIRRDAP